jgi:serine protease Do
MKKVYGVIISSLLVILLAFSGCAGQSTSLSNVETPISNTTQDVLSSSSVSTLTDIEAILENVYTEVNQSIVNVRVVQKQEVALPTVPEIPGFPDSGSPFSQGPQEYYSKGLGSGFVWDLDGDIVTNNHVVSGADEISVTFQDGTTVSGEVIGSDVDSDLAVVKVDVAADKLQPVQLADSAQVKVGQLAVAIGNPYGLEGTMTVGFVSALGRLLPVDSASSGDSTYSIPDVIQTDAPINPGNSGGVLVDRDGSVMGVTSAIISSSGANAGIGFAIPSNIVKKVVPVLIKNGHYEHPWLGISCLSLNPDIADAMGLDLDQRGALVVDVIPDSPADNAGLQGSDQQITIDGDQIRVGGDVIIGIDNQPVLTSDDLVTYLARSTEVGQSITLSILSQGKETQKNVTLGSRPESQEQETQVRETTANQPWLGIMGITVTSDIAEAMDLSPDQKGVLVEQVQQGSPADKAGLSGSDKSVTIGEQQVFVGGDIIVGLGNQTVDDMDQLQSLIQTKNPGDEVTLKVLREGTSIEIKVTLGQRTIQ